MIFYKRYIGSIQAKTGHLSLSEFGAYDRLLDHCYSTEKPLPLDMEVCFRIARATTQSEKKAVISVISQYFVQQDDGYVQHRVLEETADAMLKIEASRTNGRLGGRPKKEPKNNPVGFENEPNKNPVGFENETQQEPSDKARQRQRQKEIQIHPLPPEPDGSGDGGRFERFWSAYPRKSGKDDARKAFEKRKPDDALLSSMLAAIAFQRASPQWVKDGGQFIPYPATWLRQGRWMDETAVGATQEEVEDWWSDAGFPCVAEAENARCFKHTAHLFRSGNRIEKAHEVAA